MIQKLKVCVLPDFFLDRIISVPSLSGLFEKAKAKAASGGGSLRGYMQKELRWKRDQPSLRFGVAFSEYKPLLYWGCVRACGDG